MPSHLALSPTLLIAVKLESLPSCTRCNLPVRPCLISQTAGVSTAAHTHTLPQVPQFQDVKSSGRPRPLSHLFPSQPSAAPLSAPAKRVKGIADHVAPCPPAPKLAPCQPVQVHELPCLRRTNAHTGEPRPVSRFLLIGPSSCPAYRVADREGKKQISALALTLTHPEQLTGRQHQQKLVVQQLLCGQTETRSLCLSSNNYHQGELQSNRIPYNQPGH